MRPFDYEPRFLADLLTTAGEVSVVLGQSDVGKSTLIRALVDHVTAHGHSAAVLDADLGQSTFGLPTTLALVRFAAGAASPPEPIATVFVGAISPVGHLLQTLVGCRCLLDHARRLAVQTIFIDTTGLVAGPLGIELKLQKLDLLHPTQVLAMARGAELDPILQACRRRTDLTVRCLPSAPGARQRSAEERRAARQTKYRTYFAQAQARQFSLDEVGVWGRVPHMTYPDLQGLLVGLLNEHGLCLGVGRLQRITPTTVAVWTPYPAADTVRLLRFGSVAVDDQGAERLFSPRER